MKVKYFRFIEHMEKYVAECKRTKSRSPRLIFWCFFCPGGSDHKESTLLFLYKEKNIEIKPPDFLKFLNLLLCLCVRHKLN